MNQLVIAPLLVALSTAIVTLLARPSDKLQRTVSVLGGVGYFATVALLFDRVVLPLGSSGRTLVYQVSDWAAPYGIVLVADPLSAFMLALAATLSLAAIVFSVLYVDSYGQRLSYHPLYHFMVVGVTGSFLTGDIFNLFVWFEVMLMSSYILVLFYSGPEHTRAALNYVVLNLIGSAVMLLAIGGLYSTTGTLNMADLARRLADPATYGVDVLPVLGLSAVLFTVFALKAGIVPFQFWVPAAYRAAPAPVTAMLAGVTKKVGVYAIIRLYFTIFAAATLPAELGLPGMTGRSFLAFFGPVLFVMATASILFGGIGAVGREDLDGLLAYSSIGQVGFIVLPLAVVATLPAALPSADVQAMQSVGIAAALVYAFNHGLSKGLLFLVSGTVYSAVNSIQFSELGGLARRAPVLAATFFVGMLSLVGIPPLTGFFGKFLVFRATAEAWAFDASGAGVATGVALVGAIFTIAYFSRGWNRVFWGDVSETVDAHIVRRWTVSKTALTDNGADSDDSGPRQTRSDGGGSRNDLHALALTGEVVVLVSLALAIVGFGIGFDAVYDAADAAAQAALDTQGYVDAVDPASVEQAGHAGDSAGDSGGNGTGHALGSAADTLREVSR